MTLRKPKVSNILFIVIIVLLVWPRTRQPIQVFLHKGLALFSPSKVSENKRNVLTDYRWKLVDLDENTYDFETGKGEVILINFWATWCPPCIAEMPAIQDLYDEYGDRVKFLLVSNEQGIIVKKFLEKNSYSFNSYRPKSDIPDLLNTRSIPRTLVINKRGEVVIDKAGAANWNSETVRQTLDKLLAE